MNRRGNQFSIRYYGDTVQAQLSVPAIIIPPSSQGVTFSLHPQGLMLVFGPSGSSLSGNICNLPQGIKRQLDLKRGSNVFDPIRIGPRRFLIEVKKKGA